MDKAVEDRIREKMRGVWKDTLPPEKLDGALEAFINMIRIVDDDPDWIAEEYGEIAKLDWPSYRNQCAEEGRELTPEEMKFVFDAYQMAHAVWELEQEDWGE